MKNSYYYIIFIEKEKEYIAYAIGSKCMTSPYIGLFDDISELIPIW